MSVFLVAHFAVKDATTLAEYSEGAGPLIASFGGKLLFKGGVDRTLYGTDPLPSVAVFQFPDQEKLNGFYHSKEYQALVSLRISGAEMVLSAHAAA